MTECKIPWWKEQAERTAKKRLEEKERLRKQSNSGYPRIIYGPGNVWASVANEEAETAQLKSWGIKEDMNPLPAIQAKRDERLGRGLHGMEKKDLVDMAARKGLTLEMSMTKDAMMEAVESYDPDAKGEKDKGAEKEKKEKK